MDNKEMFRLLCDVCLFADIEELPFPALRTAYGDDFVVETCEAYRAAREQGLINIAEAHAETITKFRVAEALLRLANGHALPANLGMPRELAGIYEALGIDPTNTGDYLP